MGSPTQIYIDGQAGTTALRIRDWLKGRQDIEILTLPDHLRKDNSARKEALEAAEIAVLCLPDDAAREVAEWTKTFNTRIIDASTAHRVDPQWTYGLPELTPDQRSQIRSSSRISNPGCYSSAFILLTRPLRDANLLSSTSPISIHALSGYSGGGRQLIEKWQTAPLAQQPYEAPYACFAQHKHIPEMVTYAKLETTPLFQPAVGAFECGMRVQVPLHANLLNGATAKEIHDVLKNRYDAEPFVKVQDLQTEDTTINEQSYNPQSCNDTNLIKIHVLQHNQGHVVLMAILDNLGKGASGMAIQSLNILLGQNELSSLPTENNI